MHYGIAKQNKTKNNNSKNKKHISATAKKIVKGKQLLSRPWSRPVRSCFPCAAKVGTEYACSSV